LEDIAQLLQGAIADADEEQQQDAESVASDQLSPDLLEDFQDANYEHRLNRPRIEMTYQDASGGSFCQLIVFAPPQLQNEVSSHSDESSAERRQAAEMECEHQAELDSLRAELERSNEAQRAAQQADKQAQQAAELECQLRAELERSNEEQ
jgi:hypothetical protein